MKRAVITGPTGSIGLALINELVSNGVEVVAVVRPGSRRADRIKTSDMVKRVDCDLSELNKLPELIREGADVFYHFGWDGTFGNSRNNMYGQNLNVKYALDAVEAAFALGCDTFIGAGSQAEYGRYEGSLNESVPAFPENGYGIAKLCAGQMTRIACKQKGMRHIWTRILSIYGPYDGENTMVMSTIYKLLNSEKPSCTKGEQMWDFLYSKDAALAMRLLGEKGTDGRTYCIGSGKARPLKEYIDILCKKLKVMDSSKIKIIPYGQGQVMHLEADISKLKKDTGWLPKVSFEDGIEQVIQFYRKRIE